MDKKKENNSKLKPKVKLSREELLAGKILPETESAPESPLDDPLFHSPDDLLEKAARNTGKNRKTPPPLKPAKGKNPDPESESPILKDESQFLDSDLNSSYSKPRPHKEPLPGATPLHKPKQVQPDKSSKNDLLLKTIYEMKYRHEKELSRWKLYEQQVNSWKDRVLMIVGQLKKELQKSKADLAEMDALKEMLAQKDDEIKRLKHPQHTRKKKSSS